MGVYILCIYMDISVALFGKKLKNSQKGQEITKVFFNFFLLLFRTMCGVLLCFCFMLNK